MAELHSTDDAAPGPVVVVAGPTASGKSACAVALARAFDGVVINADSMQIYAELHVVTARPSSAEEAAAPHRLYGVLSVREPCSAGRWLAVAAAEIDAARAAGRLPIVCGGTGLYLKALMEGLSPIPEIPAAARDDARALYERMGGAAFRDALAALDPAAAARLPAGDRQRLVRAYEIVRATGRTQDAWAAEPPLRTVTGRFAAVVLVPDRQILYPAIDARFDAMMAAGALDEVRRLHAMGLDPALPACKAVGVRELLAHLDGVVDLDGAVAKAKQASRNYAKRQMTWLRTQVGGGAATVRLFDAQYSESLGAEIFSFVRHYLLT